MQIYNSRALTRNERFRNGLIAGFVAMMICGIVLGLVIGSLPIIFEFFYTLVGYGVGYAIRTYGRGVQKRFSVMGAIYTLLAIWISDVVSLFGIGGLIYYQLYGYAAINTFAGLTSIWGILRLVFKGAGVVVGYEQSRIV